MKVTYYRRGPSRPVVWGSSRYTILVEPSDAADMYTDICVWLVPGTFDDNGDPLPEYR